MAVWYKIFNWLGVVIVMPPNLFTLFDCVSESTRNSKMRRGFRLVWHSVIWLLWKARNDVIFNNTVEDLLEIVERVKILSWKWSVERLKISPCLYYE
jgi:hypothetical protein